MATEEEIRTHIREMVETSDRNRGIPEGEIARNVRRAFALRVRIQSLPERLREMGRLGLAEIGKLDSSENLQQE